MNKKYWEKKKLSKIYSNESGFLHAALYGVLVYLYQYVVIFNLTKKSRLWKQRRGRGRGRKRGREHRGRVEKGRGRMKRRGEVLPLLSPSLPLTLPLL